jgi:large subunit ribosomal protein L27
LVVPGVIIYRQRGTKWHPGENCDIGRDHTIFAKEKGFVRYYRDPLKHPKRRYIGVVFSKEEQLPVSPYAPRRRRLGMLAITRPNVTAEEEVTRSLANLGLYDHKIAPVVGVNKAGRSLTMRNDGSFRERGWEIGKAMETTKNVVRPFRHDDRWTAWHKRQAGYKVKMESKRIAKASRKGGKQKKGKPSKRGAQ